MLTMSDDHGTISVLKLVTGRLTSADFGTLRQAQLQAQAQGRGALLVDLSAVRRITRSGLAALVEFQSEMPREVVLGFFGARKTVRREFDRCAVSRLLDLFETREQALKTPAFRAKRLSGVKAVLLVAGTGSRMAPMSHQTPKPLLDLLGRPVLDHVMAHLSQFGIRDFILNPGHLGPQFHAHIQSSASRSVQFLNEGRYVGSDWHAEPMGSASTLLALQTRRMAFDDDFVVLCGDAVSDVDLADMMDTHRRTGAEVTIAVQQVAPEDVQKYGIIETDASGRITGFVEKPTPEAALSHLASTGIYIVNPRALQRLSGGMGQDIAMHLMPAVLAAGGHMQVYDANFSWVDMGCGRDFYRATSRGLRGLIPGVEPCGREIRRHVWAAAGAQVSPRAVIVGPCFIGADAVVEAGAKLEGPTAIGAGAYVDARTLVRRAIVMPKTAVRAGTWVDEMIVAGTWAIDHRTANGDVRCQIPLDGVLPAAADPVSQSWPHRQMVGGM
ncbi:sugar phosphate nucleotidyltransferase [Shimia sp.]|uniref:sugar phosphate nucleotidyltransferase n=1 Tax=Shimia sp. TaxID=1954381 RepID=UPI003B8C151A